MTSSPMELLEQHLRARDDDDTIEAADAIRDLRQIVGVMRLAGDALRDDLLLRGEVGSDGITTVNVSLSKWMRFCDALAQSESVK